MIVGLGTGSTHRYFIEALGQRVARGLEIRAVASSSQSAEFPRAVGIDVLDSVVDGIDLVVDGADEIDPEPRLIKGRGGALTRENLLAAVARRMVVIADGSKVVEKLGVGVLPVQG